MPPNMPKISDADVQAAIAEGSEAAKEILRHPPTPPPNLPTFPPGLGPCQSVAGSIQWRIYQAALAFVGTPTTGLGVPCGYACMTAVNAIVANATGQTIASNTADIVVAINSGQLQQIPASEAGPGDFAVILTADQTEGHIGICTSSQCSQNVSNSSSRCQFGWFASTYGDFAAAYPGAAITFWRFV